MPPGVSHASKTGHPDAIAAASPVIPPPRIHVLAPRLVKFIVPVFESHLPYASSLSKPRTGVRLFLHRALSHPSCQSCFRTSDSTCIHNELQSSRQPHRCALCNVLRFLAKQGNIEHFFYRDCLEGSRHTAT